MSWLPYASVGVALTVFTVLAYRRRWRWTGFAEIRRTGADDEIRPARTLWDWLQLLVIPLALAGLAFLLNNSQSEREQRREDERVAREQRRADQRAVQERERVEETADEEALRGYLAQMSALMLDRKLLRSRRGADVRAVARTLTLTVARRLDGERKGVIVRFLAEANLLDSPDPKVDLRCADLRSAVLVRAPLARASLKAANLSRANLEDATLSRVDLSRADLHGANLQAADLRWAYLGQANLQRAHFSGAYVHRADFGFAYLQGADLSETDIERTIFTSADYDSKTVWPTGFDPAKAGALNLGTSSSWSYRCD